MNYDRILDNAKECECRLFETDGADGISSRFRYLAPFWNYVKYRVNQENMNWEMHFCQGSMYNLRNTYLDNMNLWCEKTVLSCIKQELCHLNKYDQFKSMEGYSIHKYIELWQQYSIHFPEMIRITLIWTEDFIEHIKEIVKRLTDSYPEIVQTLIRKDSGKVYRVNGGLSDLHEGRCVQILTFEDESKIVYKPRSLKIDLLWSSFLDFLADKAGIGKIPSYQCVNKDIYGFAEFVATSPVKDETGFHKYFYNCGFLLGAVYFLQGSDLHSENLIACGEYPVLIDVETIVRNGNISAIYDLMRNLEPYEQDSVRKSNLLPFLSPYKYLKPGSDAFTTRYYGSNNLPYSEDGETRSGRYYSEDIVNGFSLCYETILKHCKDVFTEGGVLYEIKDCQIRVLLRSTSEYARYLSLLSNKECMQDSNCFEEKFNNLKRIYYSISKSDTILPELNRFIGEEKKALEKGYIPRLSIKIDETLPCDKPFKTCLEYLSKKHDYMGETDKENQSELIMKCMSAKKAYDDGNKIEIIEWEEMTNYNYKDNLYLYMDQWLDKWKSALDTRIPYGYVVERDNFFYYYSNLEYEFSEGFLGIVPALALWYKLTRSQKAFNLLTEIAFKIENKFKLISPSIYGEGLVDGLDGICLITYKTFEMTGLPAYERLYLLSLEAIIHKKIKNTYYIGSETPSLFYSQTASIYVLSMCAKENPSAQLKLEKLVDELLKQIKGGFKTEESGLMLGMDGICMALITAQPFLSERYSNEIGEYISNYFDTFSLEQINSENYSIANGLAGHLMLYSKKMEDKEDIFLPYVKNRSFAFGSAGIIYELDKLFMDHNSRGYSQQSDLYAKYMLKEISSSAIMANQPSNDYFPSFLYGEGGIVYSLVHHFLCTKQNERKE